MKPKKCKKCGGLGWVERVFNGVSTQVYCSQCNALGMRDKYPNITNPEEKAKLMQRDQEEAERQRNALSPYASAIREWQRMDIIRQGGIIQ